MAGLDGLVSNCVCALSLEPLFMSNQNGELLAGGIVTFYKDTDRNTLKPVYQLSLDTGTGAYSYTALPNPLTLSGIGTFQDAGGNNVALYYFPYDGTPTSTFGNVELYYVTVDDAYGNRQFTREAWPFPQAGTSGGGGGGDSGAIGFANQLSNPQFARVNFIPASTLTIPISGAGTTFAAIAPKWDLEIESTGASSVMVTQTPVTGQSAYAYNPPFTLDFVIGSNITSCKLIQTLENNPDWAAPPTTGTTFGYLNASILLGAGTSVSVQYVPSAGNAAKTILNQTNTTGAVAQFNATVQLDVAASTDTGEDGFDQIVVNILNLPGSAKISNVQVVPLTTNISNIQYDQTPVNRQIDYMFNYYKDLLDYKPIPTFFPTWDFPLNPMQAFGPTIPASAIGANKSKYVWDQTIVFQSADSGVGVTRHASGAITLTAAATTQMALVTYAEAESAREILNTALSSMVSAFASADTVATISLWYTTDGSLPSTWTSNNSLIATLDADGKPATFNGNWSEVPRLPILGGTASTQNAKFTIGTSATTEFNNYGFNGWYMQGVPATNTATYFALVVGTASVAATNTVTFKSISLVPGDVPTIPAPQTLASVLAYSQRYYEKSFDTNDIPRTNAGTDTGESVILQAVGASASMHSPSIYYKASKWKDPDLITTYNPNANNGEVRNQSTGTDCSGIVLSRNAFNSFAIGFLTPGGSAVAQILAFHWTSNAVLGY